MPKCSVPRERKFAVSAAGAYCIAIIIELSFGERLIVLLWLLGSSSESTLYRGSRRFQPARKLLSYCDTDKSTTPQATNLQISTKKSETYSGFLAFP